MYPGVKRSFDYLTKRPYRKAAKFRFAAPKQARPCPSGIGGLQGQGRAGHASIRDLLELIRIFLLWFPAPKNCAKFLSEKVGKRTDQNSQPRLSLALDTG